MFWHALGALTSGAYLTEVAPVLTEAGGGIWVELQKRFERA